MIGEAHALDEGVQGSLFESAARPVPVRPARVTDSATSWAAGQGTATMREYRSRLKRDVLRLLRARPMTDDELHQVLADDHPGSIAKRRGDLVREGLVVPAGERRPTRRGSLAVVWRAVDGAG